MKLLPLIATIGALALLAACETTSSSPSTDTRTFQIAGGQSVNLPFSHGGALSVENDDVKIEVTGFILDGEKKELVYTFGFTEKKAEALRSVEVADVTGPSVEVLVVDSAPTLSPKDYWKGDAKPHAKGDPSLSWLSSPGNTLKVFRFTITTASGRQLVMHQASVWSGSSKPMIQQLMGF